MTDPLALSARILDSGVADEPVNRITQQLSELADGVALVESFSHSVAVATDEGLVVFDTSGSATGARVAEAFARWSSDPVHTIVYTHGHLDHVGGSPAFLAQAEARRAPRPRIVSHEAVRARFARYRRTSGWNHVINERQFGWLHSDELRIGAGTPDGASQRTAFLPPGVAEPEITYSHEHLLSVGGLDVHLHHARGETDDHTWAWLPSRRVLCCGDLLIWHFPNAGNPQKVQRYPDEWARALRVMATLEPELLVPAHGLPIAGVERIKRVLDDVAGVLEDLVERVLAHMNAGANLDDILRDVRVPEATLARPYLRPLYDEPEFVVRNIWRLYGGWWDANPAHLKPPTDAALAAEVAALAGGSARLLERAVVLADSGRLDLACQLAEWAAGASPEEAETHRVRADVYSRRYRAESSLMAKGIFAATAEESRRRAVEPLEPAPDTPGAPLSRPDPAH